MNLEITPNDFFDKVKDAKSIYDENLSKTGDDFNLFWILGNEQNELHHSSIIGCLLDPKDAHGQYELYLKLFLDVVYEKQPKIKQKLNFEINAECKLEIEKNIGTINEDYLEGGRIDLYLEDNKNNAIVIENKIYAIDQPKQLERYKNYIKKVRKNGIILYLTLYGTPPKDQEYDVNQLQDEKIYLISYKVDIIKWLKLCREENNKRGLAKINGLIEHYLQMLEYLTGNKKNELTMEIEKLILENPVIAQEIVKTYENLKNSGLALLKKEIMNKFKVTNLAFDIEVCKFNEKPVLLYLNFYEDGHNPYCSLVLKDVDLEKQLKPIIDYLSENRWLKPENDYDFGWKELEKFKTRDDIQYLLELNNPDFRKELINSLNKEIEELKKSIIEMLSI